MVRTEEEEVTLAHDEDVRYVYAQWFSLKELQGAVKQARRVAGQLNRPIDPLRNMALLFDYRALILIAWKIRASLSTLSISDSYNSS